MSKKQTDKQFNIGVVGLGHWGPNHVRVFSQLPDTNVTWACDADPGRKSKLSGGSRDINFTTDPDVMFADPELDAVVVATPTSTHADVVKRALAAGKDVLCEKPL